MKIPGLRGVSVVVVSCALLIVAGVYGLDALDRAYPPPLAAHLPLSQEVLDADGRLLRAFPTPEGRWRLKTSVEDVDPQFIRMLVAYEDQRFFEHRGIDVVAMGRAAIQFLTNGRIVSGASTLSMQVARLTEPRPRRSWASKIVQALRALQIERRLNKQEILALYLNLAPYGGNLEGVRAASLAWFGKEPRRLTSGEAALLVALPQLPEMRRPDRFPDAARAARQRVLERAAVSLVVGEGEAERAQLTPVPQQRLELPAYAPHLAETARRLQPGEQEYHTTLRLGVQKNLEQVVREAARQTGPGVSVALMMADVKTGEVIAEIGAADYLDTGRKGFIDMTRALRSPGSTLKPFIYGLAFEEGLIAQETIIEDRPADFSGYRPRNFDMRYQGDVTVREALQLSLNVPAVLLLDAVGPAALMVRFRRAGVLPHLPAGEAPGLAIALGGAGVRLVDLMQLYAALANGGTAVKLKDGIRPDTGMTGGEEVIDAVSAWQTADILSGVVPPPGVTRRGIAWKTGTSYGYRDAWSVGFDGRHVVGVWVGRPDNGAVPGLGGYISAAPILFEAFSRSGLAHVPLPSAPPGAVRLSQQELPAARRRFAPQGRFSGATTAREEAPRIVYPPEGAQVELPESLETSPLVLKLQGGKAPFRWLANGRPLPELSRRRTMQWVPDGAGYSTLTVIDAAGRAASVRVMIKDADQAP